VKKEFAEDDGHNGLKMKNFPFDFTFQHGKFTHDHRIETQSHIYYVDNSICFTEKESIDPSFVKNELSDNIINH